MASCSYEEIKSMPNDLSLEQEQALIRNAKAGNNEAQEALISYNIGLMERCIYRFSSFGIPHEDLFQEAVIGLLKAINNYNPSLGYRFSTYMPIYVIRNLQEFVQTMGYDFSVPKNSIIYGKFQKAKYVYRELANKLERKPSLEEFATCMGIKEDTALSLLTAIGGCVRINDNINDDSDSKDFESTIISPDESVEDQVISLDVTDHLKATLNEILTPRQLFVIGHYYGLPGYEKMKLLEIAQILNVKIQAVSYHYHRALCKLHQYYEAEKSSIDTPKNRNERLKNYNNNYSKSLDELTRHR